MSALLKIRSERDQMSAIERRIGDFVLDNAHLLRDYSSLQLANALEISQSSVVKFSQKLGYKGWPDLKFAVGEDVARGDGNGSSEAPSAAPPAGRHAALEHREQHLLFLAHVAFQLMLHVQQMRGQAARAVRLVAVDLLDAAGQADELRQLLAVALMEAFQNVFDQRRRRRLAPVGGVAQTLQRLELLSQRLGVQALLPGRIAQAGIAAAAEIQPMLTKDPGGAGQQASQVAQGLVKECVSHGEPSDLKIPMCCQDHAIRKCLI